MKHIAKRLDWMWDILMSVEINLKKLSKEVAEPSTHLVKEVRQQVESAEKILSEIIKSHKKHKEEQRKANEK
jgi:TRAP-type mannitol/chloroaromatic compound transport system substrate-binding protein